LIKELQVGYSIQVVCFFFFFFFFQLILSNAGGHPGVLVQNIHCPQYAYPVAVLYPTTLRSKLICILCRHAKYEAVVATMAEFDITYFKAKNSGLCHKSPCHSWQKVATQTTSTSGDILKCEFVGTWACCSNRSIQSGYNRTFQS